MLLVSCWLQPAFFNPTNAITSADIAIAVRNELAGELASIALIVSYTDSIESRLPAALVGGKMDAVANDVLAVAQAALTKGQFLALK